MQLSKSEFVKIHVDIDCTINRQDITPTILIIQQDSSYESLYNIN